MRYLLTAVATAGCCFLAMATAGLGSQQGRVFQLRPGDSFSVPTIGGAHMLACFLERFPYNEEAPASSITNRTPYALSCNNGSSSVVWWTGRLEVISDAVPTSRVVTLGGGRKHAWRFATP